MKRVSLSLALLLAACGGTQPVTPTSPATATAPAATPTAVDPARIAFSHVTVVDPTDGSEQRDRTVVVEGDRIVAISAGAVPGPAPGRVVDLRGKFVIPGLWDMHTHFADPASARLFVANGVTGIRVMWGNPRFGPGTDRMHTRLRDSYDSKAQLGPRMVIASQIFDGPKPIWAQSLALATPEQGRQAVLDAKKEGADFIKVYSLLPRPVYLAIAEASRSAGIPFAGHVPLSVTVAEASDVGQQSIEHLTGLLVASSSRETELKKRQAAFERRRHTPQEASAFRRRQEGLAAASYDDARARALFAKLIANRTWQSPTLTVLQSMATLDDPARTSDPRMVYVSGFVRNMWDPRNDFRTRNRTPADYAALRALFDRQLALVGEMNRAGVPLLAGTDELNPYCFAGFSLHDELGWLVKAGLSPAQALAAATSSPARFLGREAEMGTVAEGKVADLVFLDADPRQDIANTKKIAAVVSRGVFHDRAALDRMLDEVKQTAAHPPAGSGAP
jgi:imidazolonepropionase-like amidohydrolase